MRGSRIIGISGVIAWIMVGLPVIAQRGLTQPRVFAEWLVVFLLFGALFIAEMLRPSLGLLALQAGAVVVTVLLLCDGFEGTLMVLIAMRLGSRLDRRSGLLWIVVQTLALAAAIAIHWNPRSALLLTPPYFGFQILAFFTFYVMTREGAAREQLARANERLRIAQELHDAIGHHLTALTLNLEAALQRTEGDAKRDVRKAQDLARELLAEVRSIVANEQERSVSLALALRALVGNVPRPRVHLDIDDALTVADPEREHIVLRCAQEIVTNAARHSGAENLWIAIERRADALQIRAHDDGRGSSDPGDGTGLRGMRDRIEGAGGVFSVVNEPGSGFGIVAVLPA